MVPNRKKLLAVASSLALTTAIIAPAWAARWNSRAGGPDVFGTVTASAWITGTRDTQLAVNCDAEDVLKLAVIESASPSHIDTMGNHSAPAKLLIRIDSGDVKTFNAEYRVWNAKSVAAVVEGRTPDLIAVIRAIGGAQQSIGVGTDAHGVRASFEFGAFGSTAAIKTVIEQCKLARAD